MWNHSVVGHTALLELQMMQYSGLHEFNLGRNVGNGKHA